MVKQKSYSMTTSARVSFLHSQIPVLLQLQEVGQMSLHHGLHKVKEKTAAQHIKTSCDLKLNSKVD